MKEIKFIPKISKKTLNHPVFILLKNTAYVFLFAMIFLFIFNYLLDSNLKNAKKIEIKKQIQQEKDFIPKFIYLDSSNTNIFATDISTKTQKQLTNYTNETEIIHIKKIDLNNIGFINCLKNSSKYTSCNINVFNISDKTVKNLKQTNYPILSIDWSNANMFIYSYYENGININQFNNKNDTNIVKILNVNMNNNLNFNDEISIVISKDNSKFLYTNSLQDKQSRIYVYDITGKLEQTINNARLGIWQNTNTIIYQKIEDFKTKSGAIYKYDLTKLQENKLIDSRFSLFGQQLINDNLLFWGLNNENVSNVKIYNIEKNQEILDLKDTISAYFVSDNKIIFAKLSECISQNESCLNKEGLGNTQIQSWYIKDFINNKNTDQEVNKDLKNLFKNGFIVL